MTARRRQSLGRGLAWLAASAALGAVLSAAPLQRGALVAAASDLEPALREIAARFQQEHGARVELVFGSSGHLARQIREGAPFELFLSADEAFVEQLAAAGLTRDGGALYAIGRVVLFSPHGSAFDPAEGLHGLARLLREGQVRRFAIANPDHAPYGRAAEAALRRHGLWEAILPRLVLGENVSQAAQFAATPGVSGGIIAYSLALTPAVAQRGRYALIPESDHPRLRQRMVLTRRAGAAAERFYRYLQEPSARVILHRYGFQLPDQISRP